MRKLYSWCGMQVSPERPGSRSDGSARGRRGLAHAGLRGGKGVSGLDAGGDRRPRGQGGEGWVSRTLSCLYSPPCRRSLMSPKDGGYVSLFFPIPVVESNAHPQKTNHAQRSSISRVCLKQLRKCSDAGSKIVFCTLSKIILS